MNVEIETKNTKDDGTLLAMWADVPTRDVQAIRLNGKWYMKVTEDWLNKSLEKDYGGPVT